MINLEIIRKNAGKSQQETAKALGLNIKTYWSYESGRTQPSFDVVLKMADYFHCTIDYLLGHTTTDIMHLDGYSPLRKKAISMIDKLDENEVSILVGYLAKMTDTPLDDILDVK